VVPTSKAKVSPYSVIDIAPIQQQLVSEQSGPPSSPPANESERDIQDVPSSPGLPFGYSVPVPCGYATPSNVPVIRPTYTTPVIIRHFSMDEDGKREIILICYPLNFLYAGLVRIGVYPPYIQYTHLFSLSALFHALLLFF